MKVNQPSGPVLPISITPINNGQPIIPADPVRNDEETDNGDARNNLTVNQEIIDPKSNSKEQSPKDAEKNKEKKTTEKDPEA